MLLFLVKIRASVAVCALEREERPAKRLVVLRQMETAVDARRQRLLVLVR